MSSRRRRRHARSPAAAPLEDDDLLSEILLRLPPQPSSLPRASLVCKRWRCLVSDPGFVRRFRIRHRHNPPLLGFFNRYKGRPFVPTLDAPNRVPAERFSLPSDKDHDDSTTLGCRHGLVLVYLPRSFQVLVWDPVTGDQHHIAVPREFEKNLINGAVLRADGDAQHFKVVLAVADGDDVQHTRALACVYSSQTGLWGNIISTPLPYQDSGCNLQTMVYSRDAVLVGNCLYWKLAGNLIGILKFDLERQSLAVIRVPVDLLGEGNSFTVMRAEGGGLGFLFVPYSDCNAQLWKRNIDCDGIASWVLARTIELDKLLSVGWPYMMLGSAEQNNVVFYWTVNGVLMVELESLKFKKLFETMTLSYYHPFESVYSGGTCVGDGRDGAELLVDA
ncbi:F-box protein At5g03970-like [Triticum dicoccoides]|uniref:F-box protein At5g03970-like n=1 Tax=Triticum dicoccoides TaxID=85692 RepID=UPI00189195FA|nr:F-box protein At5g03970-like [Triticum dicoccoides]